MKVSELINKLQQVIAENGDDVVVCVWGREAIEPVGNVALKSDWGPPGAGERYILLE